MTMQLCLVKNIPVPWSPLAKTFALVVALEVLCSATSLTTPLADLARAYRQQPNPQTRSAVLQFASLHKDSSGALAYLVLGSEEIEEKKYKDALKHLETASRGLPGLADYTAYLISACHFEMGNYSEADRSLKPVSEQYPPSPLVEKSVILAANAFLRDQKAKKAVALVQHHQADLTTPEFESLLAHAFELDGDNNSARPHFEEILTEFPLSTEAVRLDPARIEALPLKLRLTRCLRLIDGGDLVRARRELELLIPGLSGPDADLAQVRLGSARLLARDNQGAYDYLLKLDIRSPDADAERLYWLVRASRRLDRPADFQQPLDRLAATYPRSPWRLQALRSAGDYFWVQNLPSAYEPVYRACAESFSSDPLAADCQWRVTFSAYRRHDAAAPAAFEALLQRYPDSDKTPNTLYFLGRLAETRHDWHAAHAWYSELASFYPNYFYTTLAQEKLRSPEIARASPAPAAIALLRSIVFKSRSHTENFNPAPVNRLRYERARLLASAGLDELAESELRFGAKKDGQPEVAAMELAELATQRDAPDLGIRYIKQLAPDYLRVPLNAAPEKFWKLAFPLPFREPLNQYSREHDLDPFLVAALIRQESEFNPKVVSRANAFGLAQVLPSTGREVSRKLSLHGFRANMLFTPSINLQIGTYFLRSLLDRLQGNWEATLAAYNAGPSRVAKWLAWGGFDEPADFIETIPFDETRNYVMSVLRNANLYRRLYGPKTVALASTDGDNSRQNARPADSNHTPPTPLP
jgi:soluble lytic murein transglycosylase